MAPSYHTRRAETAYSNAQPNSTTITVNGTSADIPERKAPPEVQLTDPIDVGNREVKDLAQLDYNGTTCLACLVGVDQAEHGGEDVYMLHFKLNFMNSFSPSKRIRGAEFVVDLVPCPEEHEIRILAVLPVGMLIQVSESEVTVGERFMVGASANGAPAGVNVNVEGSKGKTTRFQSSIIAQGIIKGPRTACWRLYEESNCMSGLPQEVKLIAVVRSHGAFKLSVDHFSAKISDRLRFWRRNNLDATVLASLTIDELSNIVQHIRELKLHKALKLVDQATEDYNEARRVAVEIEKKLEPILQDQELQVFADLAKSAEGKLSVIQDVSKACHWWLNPEKSDHAQVRLAFDALQRRLILMQEEAVEHELPRITAKDKQERRERSIRRKARLHAIIDKINEARAETDMLRAISSLQQAKTEVREISNIPHGFDFVEDDDKGTPNEQTRTDDAAEDAYVSGASLRRLSKIAARAYVGDLEDFIEAKRLRRFDAASYRTSSRNPSRASPSRRGWSRPRPGEFSRARGELTQSALDDFSPVGPGYRVIKLAG